MVKASLLAALWFFALVTWGAIGRVFFDLPDVGAIAGLGAVLVLLLSRIGSGQSERTTPLATSMEKSSNH